MTGIGLLTVRACAGVVAAVFALAPAAPGFACGGNGGGSAADGVEGDSSNSIDLNLAGWRVAVVRATLAPGSAPEFFIKAVYRPGTPTPDLERTPRLLALLSSRLKVLLDGSTR